MKAPSISCPVSFGSYAVIALATVSDRLQGEPIRQTGSSIVRRQIKLSNHGVSGPAL